MRADDLSSLNTIRNVVISNRNRRKQPDFAEIYPRSIGIKLTNACNLRCRHCYQWSQTGHHQFLSKAKQQEEMPYDTLLGLIKESKAYQSRLYLWGGEPLLYSHFDELAEYLKGDRRDLVICTNGTLIHKYMHHYEQMAQSLDFLIPIEGFRQQHNHIRGDTFDTVLENTKALLELKKENPPCNIKISIHTVINDENVADLCELVAFFDSMQVDLMMLCLPWYICDRTCRDMDAYYTEKFNWLGKYDEAVPRTWYGFKYRLSDDKVEILKQQLEKIKARRFAMPLLYLPEFKDVDLETYLADDYTHLYQDRKCIGTSIRTDISPEGDVYACKHFKEFTMGNINTQSLHDIWNGETYVHFRQELNNKLMPVCSKCSVLHLNSVQC